MNPPCQVRAAQTNGLCQFSARVRAIVRHIHTRVMQQLAHQLGDTAVLLLWWYEKHAEEAMIEEAMIDGD